MAKKGKEIDLGGIRVQIDPFIIGRRILMRQKLLLTSVALLGGFITAVLYKTTPKAYSSDATIAVRVDAMDEVFARTLINRAMRDLNADGEMMLMINELDLFGSMRVGLPYEMALRRMRNELAINQQTGSIGVSYMSKDPVECERVVSFATERVLSKIENLIDSPLRRETEALNAAILELEPKLKKAQEKVFEFKAKHPTIAITIPDYIPENSPMKSVETDLKRAQTNLQRCYAGARPLAGPKKQSPICLDAQAAKRKLDDLLEQYTASHPTVIAAKQEHITLQRKCDSAQDAAGEGKSFNQAECIASVKEEIRRLHDRKAELTLVGSKKPKLQQQWMNLSSQLGQLQTQYNALVERRAKGADERKVNAGNFQENFTLVDPARVPEIPSSPDIGQFATLGMAITALIGIALAALREAMRQSFLSPDEFEEQTGLPVLAILPDISND
jgi:capsular polysaccharide biosynthesis protein